MAAMTRAPAIPSAVCRGAGQTTLARDPGARDPSGRHRHNRVSGRGMALTRRKSPFRLSAF